VQEMHQLSVKHEPARVAARQVTQELSLLRDLDFLDGDGLVARVTEAFKG